MAGYGRLRLLHLLQRGHGVLLRVRWPAKDSGTGARAPAQTARQTCNSPRLDYTVLLRIPHFAPHLHFSSLHVVHASECEARLTASQRLQPSCRRDQLGQLLGSGDLRIASPAASSCERTAKRSTTAEHAHGTSSATQSGPMADPLPKCSGRCLSERGLPSSSPTSRHRLRPRSGVSWQSVLDGWRATASRGTTCAPLPPEQS